MSRTRFITDPDEGRPIGETTEPTEIEQLKAEIVQLKGELNAIDAIMARRPALDKPTRWENVEKAISFAARTDEAERKLSKAITEIARLKGEGTAPVSEIPFDWEKNAVYWHDMCEQAWRERDLANVTIKEKDAEIAALRQERDALAETLEATSKECERHRADRDALTADNDRLKLEAKSLMDNFLKAALLAEQAEASLQSLTAALISLEGEWRKEADKVDDAIRKINRRGGDAFSSAELRHEQLLLRSCADQLAAITKKLA